MKHNRSVTVIRRSCLTGNVVWIYRGSSRAGARTSYYRACQKELERVRRWKESLQRRKANILRILGECTASLSIGSELTLEQKKAVKQLQAIERGYSECYREFYEHIVEERRRRDEYKKLRRVKMMKDE